MEVMLLGRVTLVRRVHPKNACSAMEVRLLGRVTLVRPVHSWNAWLAMEVMLLGRVTLVRPVHPKNACWPMEVMLLGRVTLVNPVQLLNAWLPMEVTGRLLMVDGMTKMPEANGLEPVMVMAVPLLVNNNSALEVAVNVSSSARAHA